MTTTSTPSSTSRSAARTTAAQRRLTAEEARLARALVRWLETGERPDDLFAADVFADVSLPLWRLQAVGPEETFALRTASHPFPGDVAIRGLDQTSRGFLIEFEERWEAEGQEWYCREMIHGQVTGDRITELSIYCTGDWDEAVQRRHATQVRLIRV
jgi:hypothetical protein